MFKHDETQVHWVVHQHNYYCCSTEGQDVAKRKLTTAHELQNKYMVVTIVSAFILWWEAGEKMDVLHGCSIQIIGVLHGTFLYAGP